MLVFLLLMNASGFAIMLLDKNLARCHRRRVPEALLLAFAACFGSGIAVVLRKYAILVS